MQLLRIGTRYLHPSGAIFRPFTVNGEARLEMILPVAVHDAERRLVPLAWTIAGAEAVLFRQRLERETRDQAASECDSLSSEEPADLSERRAQTHPPEATHWMIDS